MFRVNCSYATTHRLINNTNRVLSFTTHQFPVKSGRLRRLAYIGQIFSSLEILPCLRIPRCYFSAIDMSKAGQKDTSSTVPPGTIFRNWITADGSSGYKAEKDRYHLYVSLACPWAHRTLITRKLKGLEDVISYTVVDFLMPKEGWRFNPEVDKCEKDPIFDAKYLKEIYQKVSPGYEGRVSVPVLFDKKTNQIVNNESSEIIRMFTKEFDEFCADDQKRAVDIYPEELRPQIDAINEWVFPFINIGVYRCGFAKEQESYDKAVENLFEHLDKAEQVLSKSRYLVGDRLTEADVRLYTTLARFDHVYHGHFKCNKKRIIDYPNLWGFLRDLYQTPGFAETTNFEHIRKHYMMSHLHVNPFGIVHMGPSLDFNSSHGRNKKEIWNSSGTHAGTF
uniref:glutathionyl-hydroquinone reductase YqjG-like isoform X1 n=2 Tax=Styela clava TaxID=7725 RepID=UPI00193ADC1B|nr:glutathionyl-hydroquinone reductase YqjG-like isoform X1 [Styela clava]